MYYVILILAAILIGTAVGAMLGSRNKPLMVGSAVAVVLGLVTIFTGMWIPLAVGTAIFIAVQMMQRDNYARP